MASITKTLNGRIQGVSIGPNGQLYTSIEWIDSPSTDRTNSARTRPLGRTQIRIENNKIISNKGDEVGVLSDDVSIMAKALVTSIDSVITSLIASGKISL